MMDDVLVIVPAFNEAEVIGRTLAELLLVAPRVLVVDDGSSDATAQRARAAGAQVLRLATNLNYGGALQAGFRYAVRRTDFRYLVAFDADGQHDPADLAELVAPLKRNEADYVIGSRYLEGPRGRGARAAGNRLFAAAASLALGARITDATSGLIGLTREVAEVFLLELFPQDYPDADVIVMLRRMGFRLREIPVTMRPSPSGRSMHSGILRPLYYIAKMTVSMIHLATRSDLRAKRKEAKIAA